MCQRLRAWTIRTPAGDDAAFEPEWIFCRVNGALIADFGGTSTWDGRPAAFRVTIHGGICLARSVRGRLLDNSLVYRLRHLAPPARDCHRRGS
jgi:hypothetical protein